jgi:hypothetical protein
VILYAAAWRGPIRTFASDEFAPVLRCRLERQLFDALEPRAAVSIVQKAWEYVLGDAWFC